MCGEIVTEKIQYLGHDFSSSICSRCGYDLEKLKVGMIGPAGGYIFYDVDADNGSGNSDGLESSKCGWRFLEAAISDLVVDKNQFGIGDKSKSSRIFFGYQKSGDSFVFVNGSTRYSNKCTRAEIGEGARNTQLLVEGMGSRAYYGIFREGYDNEYAAKYCNELEYSFNGTLFTDWFLPSRNELLALYSELGKRDCGFVLGTYWSSSETPDNPGYISCIDFGTGEIDDGIGGVTGALRSNHYHVRPVRAF